MSDQPKTALSSQQHPAPPSHQNPEPWLRGTLTGIDALRRQVLHALELTREDLHRWCGTLTDQELNTRPFGLPSVAFQIRHISRSLDRLLTYAEGLQLSPHQIAALASEADPPADYIHLFAEFYDAIDQANRRIEATHPGTYEATRSVGRARLPTTVGGLLIHCAEHTQRHVGQAITTAKIVIAARPA
jgi:uncharacterized damage-inducible protein DinB